MCVLLFFLLLQIKYGDTATSEGVLFATYSALIGESQAGGQHRTRLKQILEWCRENFDGVVSLKKTTNQPKNWIEKNCMLVIVLHQGAKSLGPSEVTGSSCAEQPDASGRYLNAVSTCILLFSVVLPQCYKPRQTLEVKREGGRNDVGL